MSVHYSPTISVRSLSPPELGLARVRHLKWPKSDKSDFGWEREQIEPAAPLNIKHRDSSHGEMRQVLSLAAASAMTGCPPCAGHDSECASLRLRERSDDAGRALGVPVQRLDELVARQAGLERVRLEVGANQREGVVVRRARGRAGTEIMRQPHQALATDIFLGLLGDLALRKP